MNTKTKTTRFLPGDSRTLTEASKIPEIRVNMLYLNVDVSPSPRQNGRWYVR